MCIDYHFFHAQVVTNIFRTSNVGRIAMPQWSYEETCTYAGYNAGCCDTSTGSTCRVSITGTPGGYNYCYCDQDCHFYDDCCIDVPSWSPNQCSQRAMASSLVTTCRASGLDNGCCDPATSLSCLVPGGSCYCDAVCHTHNDCCNDVVYKQCPSSAEGMHVTACHDSS